MKCTLATAFNALFASGGPGINGSYRDIQVIRNSKVVATIDVYQYLQSGNKKNDVPLRDGDIIRINPYSLRIELKGEVKKPGLYDVLTNESFAQVLTYAGGFTDNAYTSKINVYKNTSTERKVTTINEQQFQTVIPDRGDVYIIGKILNRFSNRVSIEGAVYRPGDYELKERMTVSQLIKEADGLREDAFSNRATIHRLRKDLSPQIVSFDVDKLINGLIEDIVLNKEDRVEIYSKFDLKEGYIVKIDGEVSSPGSYLFEEGMNVQDLVLLSGGLKESSSLKRVEISRRVKDTATQLTEDTKTAIIFQQEIRADLKDSSGFNQFQLEPFDEVVIRIAPGYFVQKNVVIEGEIFFAGKYTLQAKNDRISDLIKRAGGLTSSAYLNGAVLVRTRNFSRTEETNYEQGLKNLVKQSLQAGTAPNLVQAEVLDITQKTSDFVGINLERILDNPKSELDLFLNDGDTLRIPKQLQTVRVSGEVLYPTLVRYDPDISFKSYVLGAGGFGDRSSRKKSYVVYPNGSVKGTKYFLFFKNYPALSPGAEIYVPIKRERERLRTGEVITLGATLVSMLAILFSALK
ncbi:MAG: SLBB domain-containing protein [Chitinophagaceae bacterium]|nr:SLBB domain-containing protein [Chitinophagaceae bacterium]